MPLLINYTTFVEPLTEAVRVQRVFWWDFPACKSSNTNGSTTFSSCTGVIEFRADGAEQVILDHALSISNVMAVEYTHLPMAKCVISPNAPGTETAHVKLEETMLGLPEVCNRLFGLFA